MRYVFRNIVRFPKKTLVVFVLVSLILFLSMSGMFFITLCGEISERTVGPLGGTVVVTDTDGERFMLYEAAKDICSASPVIESVEAVAEYDVQPFGIKCIDGADKSVVAYSPYRYHILKLRGEEDSHIETMLSRDMKLVAVTSSDICKEFYSGNAELVEGSLISRADCENEHLKIVISDKLAKQNGLKLGDSIKINMLSLFIAPSEASVYSYAGDNGLDYDTYRVEFTYDDYIMELGEKLSTLTFTVGGIYKNNIDNKSVAAKVADINDNRVYVPISTVSKKLELINADKNFNEHLSGYAYIRSVMSWELDRTQYLFPQDLHCVPTHLYLRLTSVSVSDGLEEAINDFGFYTTVKLTPFINEAGTSPAAKILIIVRYSLIGVMIAGFVILMLIIFFNMNSRRREFAVLAALGMKRMKIALSFFGEVFAVFVAALLVCASLYAVTVRSVAAPVSEYLESSEEAADSSEMRLSGLFTENEAKKQREENMADIGFLAENYLMPPFLVTIISAASVLLLVLMPIYVSVKQINPLTESGGKE